MLCVLTVGARRAGGSATRPAMTISQMVDCPQYGGDNDQIRLEPMCACEKAF
jgi:hypothetical protein